jgi:hypothetical protein
MNLTEFFLFYLCFLGTAGVIIKIYQLIKEGKIRLFG